MRCVAVLGGLLLASASFASADAPPPSANTSTSATTPRLSVDSLAAFPVIRGPQLSPDGKLIAARANNSKETRLLLINADRPEAPPRIISLGDKVGVSDITWAGKDRLLLTVVTRSEVLGLVLPVTRLVIVDLSSGQSRVADTKSRGIYAGDVLYADPQGAFALVASQDDIFSNPSIKRVDLATGKAVIEEKARPDVWNWYVDNDGVVRAGLAYDNRRWTLWYRDKAGEPFRKIKGKIEKAEDSAVDRLVFGRAGTGMIITNEKTGRFALYRYDFNAGSVGEAVFEHPDVDITDVLANPITGEIRGIRYEDDRVRMHWIDPEMKKLQASLDKALPNAINDVVDTSLDENRVLIWSGGASDPGGYFLLDRKAKRMHPVVTPYPEVDPDQLSPVTAVSYQARDGLKIPAYLTLPKGRPASGLPLIMMPHGGPFHRDSWAYDPFVQLLASRGYAVLQPQFRGSTGYGRSFVERGHGEWGRKMQDDLDDGLDWLVKSGKVDPKRVCIFGASYGGYAALWGAIRNPERYRCAVSVAGVTDVAAQLRDNRRTFTATRYFKEWRTKVAGDLKDLSEVSPLDHAARLKVPVLIAHGEDDGTVSVKQGRAMVQALTKARADVTSVFYKDMGHDFDEQADLKDFMQRLDAFLAKHNPA